MRDFEHKKECLIQLNAALLIFCGSKGLMMSFVEGKITEIVKEMIKICDEE